MENTVGRKRAENSVQVSAGENPKQHTCWGLAEGYVCLLEITHFYHEVLVIGSSKR